MHEIACTRTQTQTSGGSLIADLQCAATLRYHPMSFSYSNSIAANTTSKAHAKALCAAECEPTECTADRAHAPPASLPPTMASAAALTPQHSRPPRASLLPQHSPEQTRCSDLYACIRVSECVNVCMHVCVCVSLCTASTPWGIITITLPPEVLFRLVTAVLNPEISVRQQ